MLRSVDWGSNAAYGKGSGDKCSWYNALSIYATLLQLKGNTDEAITMFEKATLVAKVLMANSGTVKKDICTM
jgi:hypothetical protein